MEKDFKTDVTRETWRNHTLYKKSVAELQQQCRKTVFHLQGKSTTLCKDWHWQVGARQKQILAFVLWKIIIPTEISQ